MKALLHICNSPEWPQSLHTLPWPLLPVGNRPLLEYWLELCVDLGIQNVRIVMNDFAAEIEEYAQNGDRWGLHITYGFEKDGAAPLAYLRRSPEEWENGLLHIRGPVFPAHTKNYCAKEAREKLSGLLLDDNGVRLMIARTPEEVSAYLAGKKAPSAVESSAMKPVILSSAAEFYHLNQRMVGGESRCYLTPGYQITADNCHIGANTVILPTARIIPPVMIGDNCRIDGLTTVGPNAVIGNYVVVDQNTELDHCVILDGSYIGHNMEIRKKVISGTHLYDVEHDVEMEIPDPWLLDTTRTGKNKQDPLRAITGWILALPTALFMAIPYELCLLLSLRRPLQEAQHSTRLLAKIFYSLSLDIFPKLLQVLSGQLWLCGHSIQLQYKYRSIGNELPRYFPAVISYEDLQRNPAASEPSHRANAFYYMEMRSPLGDLRLFTRFLIHRLVTFGTD